MAVLTRTLTRRQRARITRGVQYLLFAAAILLLGSLADWGQIRRAFFDLEVVDAIFPQILTTYLLNTVTYTAAAFAFGLVLGLVLALMRLSSAAPYRWLANIYIEFFRGVPALLVILAFGFGIPIAFNTTFPGGTLGTIAAALGLVAAGYMAETIRAGIQAVPRGQTEAARSLGMSPGRAMISIVLPPPLTNELILLAKESALVDLLGLTLMTSAWLMLQRNLLYTAVTRAKRLVVLVGSRRAPAKAVRTQGAGRRYTPHRAATADEDHGLSRPSRWAIAAASPRPVTPSLARILETWTLAVLGVMNSAWPICRFVRPSATSASTSTSRRVRPSEVAGEGRTSGDAVVSSGSSRRRRPRWASNSTSRRSGAAPSATVVWWAARSAGSACWRDPPAASSASASRKRA